MPAKSATVDAAELQRFNVEARSLGLFGARTLFAKLVSTLWVREALLTWADGCRVLGVYAAQHPDGRSMPALAVWAVRPGAGDLPTRSALVVGFLEDGHWRVQDTEDGEAPEEQRVGPSPF